MARVFVKDPATGKPAVEVTNYQVVELTELEQAVSDLQSQMDAKQTEVDNLNEQVNVAQTELDALGAQQDDAKSELEAAQGVVEQPAAEVDPGTDATSSEGETPAPAEASVEF